MVAPTPRVLVPATAAKGEVVRIKTLISHPMETGLRRDGQGKTIPRRIINSTKSKGFGEDYGQLLGTKWNPGYQASATSGRCPMRTVLLACIVIGTMMLRAEAQAVKPAVGSEELYWIVTLQVKPDQLADFKKVVAPLVAATQQEPGTLEYEYNVGADQSTIDIFERYRDSNAAVAHVTQTFGPKFSKPFLALAKPTRLIVYGTPSAEAKKVLAPFNPVYMTPIDGFTR
jgi:quinol monooxygenase YgiN